MIVSFMYQEFSLYGWKTSALPLTKKRYYSINKLRLETDKRYKFVAIATNTCVFPLRLQTELVATCQTNIKCLEVLCDTMDSGEVTNSTFTEDDIQVVLGELPTSQAPSGDQMRWPNC